MGCLDWEGQRGHHALRNWNTFKKREKVIVAATHRTLTSLRGPFSSTRPLRGLLRTPAPWAGGPSPSFPNLPYYTFSPLSAKAACRLERWSGMARAGIFFVLVVAPSLSSLLSAFFSLFALPLLSSPLLSPPLPPCREASFSRAQWRREWCFVFAGVDNESRRNIGSTSTLFSPAFENEKAYQSMHIL